MLGFRHLIIVWAAGLLFSFFFSLFGGNSLFIIVRRSLAGSIMITVVLTAAYAVLKNLLSSVAVDTSDSVEDTDEIPSGDDDEISIDYEKEKQEGDALDEMPDNTGEEVFVEEVEEETVGDISFIDRTAEDDEIVEVMNDDDFSGDELLPGMNNETAQTEGKNEAFNYFGDNIDAGTMANAIKTILKKDQKG